MQLFRDIIRQARGEKKYSLSRLAQITKTFKGYICGIETGKLNPPSPKMIQRLCKALDLDYNRMLAQSAFEKLPEGLRYDILGEILGDASKNGKAVAPGGIRVR